MKKILYSLILGCFISISGALANVDFSQAIEGSSMPTDAEIMQIISKFNFDDNQKQIIFKETKRKLQELYAVKNTDKANSQLNQYLNQVNDSSTDKYVDTSIKQELMQDVSKLPKTSSQNSQNINQNKNTSASSSTKKTSKYGPKRSETNTKSYKAQNK